MDQNIEKINYITDYLTNYNQYMTSLNKLGFTDAAVLFEMFAEKVCNLWFGQLFHNLNVEKANYPYVDLISEDEEIFVQVSTVQNVPEKIKRTLENIKTAVEKEPKSNIRKITSVKFFVTGNDSIKNVKDYTGDNKIGNVEFQKTQDLITFQKIIERCKNEEIFLKELYIILHDEPENYKVVTKSLSEAVERSNILIDKTIVGLIGGKYEIDRAEIIHEIKSRKNRFISIEGQAGSGKSALCKMILKGKNIVLFARAEKFAQANSLFDIWNINIREVLKYLNGKEIFFYIDALEYISDCSRTTQDLLVELYSLAQQYDNVYIITSCRTSEKQAFNRITATFNVLYYIVPELTSDQIIEIARVFPAIYKYVQNPLYRELFRIPFNIELFVNNVGEGNEFTDVNSFRTFIWKNIICLDGKVHNRNFTQKDIRDTIDSIVFTRATKFSVGVPEDDYNSDIIEFLLSNNVLISNEESVRLKYDIYEDICFEQKIDSIFESVRGNYTRFFTELEKLGRCVHRRYQIWIENKLFGKDSRKHFLYQIIEDSSIPKEWNLQTLTGIIKSDLSGAFFDDFKNVIIRKHIQDFVDIANSRSFEPNIIQLKDGNAFSKLIPCGKGRLSLIRMVFDTKLYENESYRTSIIKLCSDYANTNKKEKLVSEDACCILEYYVDFLLKAEDDYHYYNICDEINSILNSIYQLAECSASWIREFWKNTIKKSHDSKARFYEKIIENVIKSQNEIMLIELARYLPKQMLNLVNAYWLDNKEDSHRGYYSKRYDKSYEYGLNYKAAHYSFDFNRVENNHLFRIVSIFDFWRYLEWAICFTNRAAQQYKENYPDVLTTILILDEKGAKHEYMACQEFWNAGVEETAVPDLIGDVVYILIRTAAFLINTCIKDNKDYRKFADSLKKEIICKSNNIMMLTVIEELGFLFRSALPAYAIELVSSIDLIHLDIVKYAKTHSTVSQRILEKYILASVSMPESAIKRRYDLSEAKDYTLQTYMITEQLIENVRTKAEAVLDYLYSITQDSKETANDFLQIQKMDLRLAKKEEINNFIYRFVPQPSGNAKALVEEAGKGKSIDGSEQISDILSDVIPKIENNTLTVNETIAIIEELTALIKDVQFPYIIEEMLVQFWAYALNQDDLPEDKRSEYCDKWIERIEGLMHNESFHLETNLCLILFKQLQKNLDKKTSNNLKKLLYDLLRYHDSNGVVLQIRNTLTSFLDSGEYNVSQLLFDTCLALLTKKDITEEEIIKKYLYFGSQIGMDFDLLENFNFGLAADFINCGMKLSNSSFKKFVQLLVLKARENVNDDYMDKDYHAINLIENFFSNKIIKCEETDDTLDVLFFEFDNAKKGQSLFEFYDGCFTNLLAAYFDAKKDPDLRFQYEILIAKLEQRISLICDKDAKKEMYRYMFLTLGNYHIQDWNEIDASYSIMDKHFLTMLWSKYGKYHPEGLLSVIYQMHIRELLPDILIPLQDTINALKDEDSEKLDSLVKNSNYSFILNEIISDTYLYYYDQVRNDERFSNTFIDILSILEETSFSGAGVIMDEFLGH